MEQKSKIGIVVSFVILMALVFGLSSVSMKLWGAKPEKAPVRQELVFEEGMTVSEFGKANQLPNPVLKEVFGLASKEDLQRKVTDFKYSREQIVTRAKKISAIEGEESSKNWAKIFAKFALWFVFLGIVFFLVRRRKVTFRNRRWVLLSGVVLFGIILGSDPSPMGTVKDAIGLFAKSGVIFPPRMIALTVFLILVFVANKFICTWGCQFGTLQDFIFRFEQGFKGPEGDLQAVQTVICFFKHSSDRFPRGVCSGRFSLEGGLHRIYRPIQNIQPGQDYLGRRYFYRRRFRGLSVHLPALVSFFLSLRTGGLDRRKEEPFQGKGGLQHLHCL